MIKTLLLLIVCLPSMAFALVTVDGNIFYLSDSFATSTTSSYSRILYDAALSLGLSKKGSLMLGWDYNSATFSDNINSSATTVAISGMGPKLTYFFDKDYRWSLGFTYDLILNGTNTTSSSSVQLQGTAIKVETGYASSVADGVDLGIKLNYYEANFSDTITNSTTLTKVSYHRTILYPSLSFLFRFD